MKFYQDREKILIRVGIVTVLGLIILFWGYGWLAKYLENTRYDYYLVRFENAANLEIGSPVSVLGVKKGKVNSIKIESGYVILDLAIESDVALKQDAAFSIIESNLMGDVQVEVAPGKAEGKLDPQKVHTGERAYSMSGLVSQLSDLIGDLQTVIGTPHKQGNIFTIAESLAQNSNELVKNLNESYLENKDKIESIITDIAILTENISILITDNRDRIENSIEYAEQTFTKADSTMIKLDLIADNLHLLSEKMLQDDTTLGNLISDRELYDNLNKATESLDSLLIDIRNNPKKYIRIKLL
ncbi:MAG: MCE family protein [Candidatus Cloacimonetes bacterium]|nr:MCE family protein [Candidatus Cloacimonadota bacterium]